MARVVPINLGYLSATVAQWYGLPPSHPAAQHPGLAPILCFYVQTRSRRVLVDAASYDFPPGFEDMLIPGQNLPPLLEQLRSLGVEPEQITDLVITHPHVDHVNGLTAPDGAGRAPVFRQARHYLGAADWQPEGFAPFQREQLEPLETWGLLERVAGPLDLGDGLSLLPLPGETPGHQGLRLSDGQTEVYFVGDLYHHPLEFAEEVNVVWADPATMRQSKRLLGERASGSGAEVYFSHLEGAYRAALEGGQVRWRRVPGLAETSR